MPRSINPVPQYTRGGEPLDGGKMFFFETGTNTPKNTFSDMAETPALVNTHPVILDAEGRLPNVFFSGVAKQVFTDKDDVQIFSRDPVGQQTTLSAFDIFSAATIYQKSNITTTSDGRFWKSIVNGNVGLNPVTDDGSNWQEIDFNNFWAKGVTYSVLASAISPVDGLTYISLKDSNVNNDPNIDTGTNWVLDRATLNFVIGKTYETGECAYDNIDLRRYISQQIQSGNVPSTDDGTNWLPYDGVVTTPVNTLPANLATGVSRTPLLTLSAYSILGSTNAEEWVQFQLSTDAFVTIAYDSGITRDFSGHTVEIQLDVATIYSFRAFRKGVRTDITAASTVTTFTTTIDLSLIVSLGNESGTGVAKFVTTGVDLTSGNGSIWVRNRENSGFMMKVNTVRGLLDTEFPTGGGETVNTQGVTSLTSTGFNIGTDVRYNGNNQDISSFVFKDAQGLHDTVVYVGDSTSGRTEAHNLNAPFGAILVKRVDANEFSFGHKDLGNVGIRMNSGVPDAGHYSGVGNTSTTFGLGSDPVTNGFGFTYIAEIFAHNPDAGIFCGSYAGDGISGLKIVTGFAVGWFFSVPTSSISNVGALVADIRTGTLSHLNERSTASVEVVGSVVSFDSDGVTLSNNNFNVNNESYSFVAIADPLLF